MKEYKSIEPELQNVFAEYQNDLQHHQVLKKRNRKFFIFTLLSFVGLFATAILIFPIFIFFGLIFYFGFKTAKYDKELKAYENQLKADIVTKFLNLVFEEIVYKPNFNVKDSIVQSSGIFPKYAQLESEDYIKAKFKSTDIELTEITLKSNGEEGMYTTFRGLFVIADFNKEFSNKTLVITAEDKPWYQQMFSSNKPDVMDNGEFNELYTVYGTDKVQNRFILSHSFMERLIRIREKYNCAVNLNFKNSKMFLAIDWRQDFFEISNLTSSNYQDLFKNYYDQLGQISELIDELNLNTRIWGEKATT